MLMGVHAHARTHAHAPMHTHPPTHPRTHAPTHPRTHAPSRLDCSIRFWDPTATPHLLTAPEGGAHVRVSAGVFAPMAPEWTLTNPSYVNCLLLQTEDPPVSLALAAGSSGPESLLALCVRPELEAPAGLEVRDLQGGSLGLWGVTRNSAEVEAWRFDEPLGKEAYMKLEASAAAAWREEMTRIKGKGGKGGKGGDDQEDRAERAQQRVMELLRRSVLQRGPAGLDAPLELHALREAFEEALMHARHVEEEKARRGRKQPEAGRGDELRSQLQAMLLTERAAARPRAAWEREPPRKGEGGAGESSSRWREVKPPPGALDEEAPPEAPLVTTLSLAQAFSLLSSHKLLGGKLSKAADLRTWLSELLDFKPAWAAMMAGQQDQPSSSSTALAPAPALTRKGKNEVLDELAFVRLLNDVDPLARLRDSAGKLAALVAQLAVKVPKPRGAARLTAERHLKSWRAKCTQLDEQLSSIAACVRAHAGVLVSRQLRALLPAPARPPSQDAPGRPGQTKLPALAIERATPLVEWDEPPRTVFAATDLDGAGDGVARRLCVAVLTERRAGGFGAAASGQKATAGSTAAEHAALELSVAKLLGGSAGSFFSRCLGSINHPPTLLSPDPELHIVYEYMSGQRGANGLVQAHGPLRSAPLTCVLRSWGRQLLLALEAAHRQRLLLRTLRLRHLTVSPDGQRLKLGPSALANVALTDGSAQGGGGGGKLLIANDLPPLDGPLTREMLAAADTADADAAPSAAPTPTPQAMLDEEVLAPELLLPAVCAQADLALPLPPGAALASGTTAAGGAASTPAYPPLTAACDVWLFGRMLFELHFGEAPDSFSASVARHWHECGQAAHGGLQQLVPDTLSPLPPAGQPSGYSDGAPPSHHYDPFSKLKRPAPKAAQAQAAGGPRGAGGGVELGWAEMQIAQRKSKLVDLAPAARLPSRARSWLPSAEGGDTHSEPAPPLLLDLIGACLQPRPSARPSVAALLGSPFFALDVGAILTAKRNAAAYLATPKPAAIVQRDVAAPLLEAQRAAALSGRLPARLYEQALQAAIACCTRPRRVLRAGGVQEGADRQSSAEELAALGAPDADELQACAALVAEVVATCDAFSCLRKLSLEDFGAAHGQGMQMHKAEPRAASVLELGRALRMLLTHADLDDSYLAPHVPALLAQLFELWSGDARLHSPEATLAGAPPATPAGAAKAAAATKAAAAKATNAGTSAAAAAEKAHAQSATIAATTAGERAAATKGVLPSPRSAAAAPPAWPDKAAASAAMSDGSLVGRLAQSAPADGGGTRYLSWVQPSVGPLEDWQVYCEEGVGHWSVPLWRLLHPIVSGVLSEEGGGSLAMPALRDVIRRQGAPPPPPPPLAPPSSSAVVARSSAGGGGAEEVDSPPPLAADVVPLQFENFHPVSSKPTPRLDSRGARPPPPSPSPRPLSRDHCAELLNVQGSLQRLTDTGRRARATALSHLSGVLRTAGRAHGAVLCAELGVPRHASALLSDPEAEARLGRRPTPTLSY